MKLKLNREVVGKIISLVNSREEVHYSDLAMELNVSLSTAQRYAMMFSKYFENYVEYKRGKIYRKKMIGINELDDETRIKALQHTLDTLNNKLNFIKNELTKMLSNDFEHHSKEEIREKIKKLLEEI